MKQILQPPVADGRPWVSSAHVAIDRFISRYLVRPAWQPIVTLASREIVGYELLTRAGGPATHLPPSQLFQRAATLGLEQELCQHLRRTGLEYADRLGGSRRLFLNVRPTELRHPERILDSLAAILDHRPSARLVVEIHEESNLELDAYVRFRRALRSMGIAVAFDDFGTGRSRLLEMATAPPDFVKLAANMVRSLDRRPRFRRKILRPILHFIHSGGAASIAESVETEDEAIACQEMGIRWAQGYHLGRPIPVGELELSSLPHYLVEKDAVG